MPVKAGGRGGKRAGKAKGGGIRKGPPASQAIALKNKGGDDDSDGSDSAGTVDFSDSEDEGLDGYRRGGYHPVQVGEAFKGGAYTVLKKLGWGHFSTVWLVACAATGAQLAMKVQKSAKHYTEAAMDEVQLLQAVNAGGGDAGMRARCVELVDWFEHEGPFGSHVCMVFETLGDNLLALIKRYNYRGLPLPLVRRLTVDILQGLDYMHRECSIIHTDLKPENVMLTLPLVERSAGAQRRGAPSASPSPSQDGPMPHAEVRGAEAPEEEEAEGGQADAEAADGGEAEAEAEAPSAVAAALNGGGLTRNQRKKLKKKQKKAAEGGQAPQPAQPPAPKVRAAAPPQQHGNAAEAGGSGSSRRPDPDQRERLDPAAEEWGRWHCKIVDFGNACWTHKQLTCDIQTRQYRCPEAIMGAKYSTPVDIWSVACMVFELVTGDLLFEPRSGERYSRDEDHLALCSELLGRIPKKVALSGKYSKEFFNRQGELRNIKRLRFWAMDEVLQEKYHMERDEAKELASFLVPMLDFVPQKRATAAECLMHPWLQDPDSVCRSPTTPARATHANGDVAPAGGEEVDAEAGGGLRPGRAHDSDGVKARRSASPERGGSQGRSGEPSTTAPRTPAQVAEGEEAA
eukprot:jgi/Tetstr1/441364/TSEL_029613.t1